MFDLIEPLVFGLLAAAIVGAGAAVVLADRITASALFMAFTFLNMAGMFVLLGAETIAAFQVLIYVGAITVLILYG
ncbi:MAG: NADH-quinone oxidoreductase subunit J, partial [Chloroflexota bacterium]